MRGLLCAAIAWAHTIVATLSFRYAVMPPERTLWQLAARNVTAMTRCRSSETTSAGSSGARRSRSRASASAASASPLRPCGPGRIQIGVETCLRLWVLARAVSNEGAAGLSFEPAAPRGAGRANQPLLSRHTAKTFLAWVRSVLRTRGAVLRCACASCVALRSPRAFGRS